MHVAPPADTAMGHHRGRVRAIEVGDQRAVGIERDGADRDHHGDVGPIPSCLAPTCAIGARLCLPTAAALVERQIVELVGGREDYRTAATAVPAIGSAARDKRFTPERR